jgi:hypothetical protein
MPSHILVNGLGLTFKSSMGISTATIPDVCKTPTPGGPVPIPYPNFANQSTLSKGTKSVKVKNKMIAVKGSRYAMSMGDEPGTIGGIKSNTFKQHTDWITYSFDVKMDGKNACRHSDKKFHNKKNAVDLAGNIDPVAPAVGLDKIADECNKKVNDDEGFCPDGPEGEDCTWLGTMKHKCCEDAINAEGHDALATEHPFMKNANPPPKYIPAPPGADANARAAANQAYEAAISARMAGYKGGTAAQQRANARRYVRNRNVWSKAYFANGGGAFRPDVVSFTPPPPPTRDNTNAAYDFKFNCKDEGGDTSRLMTSEQKAKYTKALGVEPKILHKDGRKC